MTANVSAISHGCIIACENGDTNNNVVINPAIEVSLRCGNSNSDIACQSAFFSNIIKRKVGFGFRRLT